MPAPFVRLLCALLAALLAALTPFPRDGGVAAADEASDEAADLSEEAEDEADRQEAFDEQVERAWNALRTGNHDEVRARMDRAESLHPGQPVVPYLRAKVAVRVGELASAQALLEEAVTRHPQDRALAALRLAVLLDLGRYEDVERLATEATGARPDDAAAHAARGLALEALGRRDAALEAYDAVIGAYNRGTSPPEDLPWIARAAIRATRISTRTADDLLPDALKLLSRWLDDHPQDQEVLLLIADLFQEDRGSKGQSVAAKYYKKLLDKNPELADARVGLARTFLVFYQQDRAIRELERALVTNGSLVAARALLASIHVADGDYDQARTHLEKAQATNPRDRTVRAVRAGMAWITGDRAGYEALEQEALAADPQDGRFFVTVADLVGERQRQYDVAATFARKATETDVNDPLGYVTLGEALMNLGRTDEARVQFRTAVARSKRYEDVKRDNWLEVLDVLDGFRTVASPRFVTRLHPSETQIMERYLPPLLEEAWNVLSAKYGFVPEAPVQVDAFHRADDFSIRSVGVEGLPALGVCFGRVITLLGPTSRPLGSFSWAQTAWHEFAHTITLGLSHGQVPRWLTEGLSVHEERMRRPHWGRGMEVELYHRYRNDRLLRMAAINSAFRGPDIMFAYYQGGLIADHLTATRGFEVIPRMLAQFAEDRTTAEVFRDVLGIELADYDTQLRAYVGSIVGDYRMVPLWDDASLQAFVERTAKDPADAEASTRLGWARLQRGNPIEAGAALARAKALTPQAPEVVLLEGALAESGRRLDLAEEAYERYLALGADDVHVRMFLAARLLESGGDSEAAREHLEAARRAVPTLTGKDSPTLAIARLHEAAGRVEEATREYAHYATLAGDDYGVRQKLLAWHRGRGEHAEVARIASEMVEINPFGAGPGQPPDVTLHRAWAEALQALGRGAEALGEREVQVALVSLLPEQDRVAAGAVDDHLALGRALITAGRAVDALTQAAAALRLSPDHAGARMLKAEAEEAAGYR